MASGKATKLVGDGSVTSVDGRQQRGDHPQQPEEQRPGAGRTAAGRRPADRRTARAAPAAGDVLKDVSFGDYEQFEFKGWNNDTVHGYVVKPHNYQEGKSYPVAFWMATSGRFGNG